MLDPDEVLDRFLAELRLELTKADREIQARLQEALGLRKGYIHDMFRRRYWASTLRPVVGAAGRGRPIRL